MLDFSVQSNYCHGCSLGPKPGEGNYKKRQESHSHVCQENFGGSSNTMEVEAASVIFSRSKELHNMQYTTVLSDRDSKAFLQVSSLNNKEIVKEDCVNHVARRVFARVDKIKKAKKGLGGKGQLTKVVMKKLTGYYASTLKENAPDVRKMQQGVFATLLHSYSTDEEPRHVACPPGEDSWCHYNRHQALLAARKPSTAQAHHPAFSKAIVTELCPLYNRLGSADLLERC